ncbi:MAG: DNA polymerase III subunit epsilon [Acidiferrobacteraceae bacterium]|nr:DNA polymerase III subunit epsilon [Acidiferrobacteraceae bacterium]|tara:strand:+ start:309 stop:1013 length:705 start_codon:yes stop_codon:yes gene_type:complete
MRQVILDTETTGLEWEHGHRVIEIGCVELLDRQMTKNQFHCFLNPERNIDHDALHVHGISEEFLADKPKFGEIVEEFMTFIEGSELIIHNAPFDIGFLNNELSLIDKKLATIGDICKIQDTLQLARQLHPGQRNSLDALCKRYNVDNSHRSLHGALLDAEILAEVYLAMTGGQTELLFQQPGPHEGGTEDRDTLGFVSSAGPELKVIYPTTLEREQHDLWVSNLSDDQLWKRID